MEFRFGMVLSGGGSRGLAHVGVLKALSEEGLAPDCLAGTSAGAIVAALYAAGCSDEQILEFFITRNPFRISKLSLVKPGIFDTDKVVADLREYLPDDSFSALERKVFLTATDLLEGRPEIFASGSLVSAILASASIPLVFTPIQIDGRLYSDGGITNNFPVEPLVGLCDTILGVYASPLESVSEESLSNSLAVSQRALEIGMYYGSRSKFHYCDLVLCPPELEEFGTFESKHFADIMEIGYQAARAQMGEIRRLAR